MGLLGTISYDLGARTVPSYRTTPESLDIFGMLAQMRDAGCHNAVMEVSSHGIAQQRVLGLEFGVAVFTNLTRDHLDFHKTLESYFEVKTRLFTGSIGPVPRIAVVNLDDPYGERLAERIRAEVTSARLVTYGENPKADVRAEDVDLKFRGTAFQARMARRARPAADSPLVGRYNVSNFLAAAATAWALGRDPFRLFVPRLRDFKGVPGQDGENRGGSVLQRARGLRAHRRRAQERARHAARHHARPLVGCLWMRREPGQNQAAQDGRAVQEFADYAYATADNPRNEQVGKIFDDMKEGVADPDKITWIDDRRRAISLALDSAKAGDSLLIAGKGHEGYQEFADTVIPFDDRQVVRELIGVKALRT